MKFDVFLFIRKIRWTFTCMGFQAIVLIGILADSFVLKGLDRSCPTLARHCSTDFPSDLLLFTDIQLERR
jgi:hypothetical protein